MFCNNFDSLSSLKGLILNGNNFTKVPEFVYQQYKLEVLGLSNCRSFPSLSMHLLFLRFLRCLDLSYCNIFDGGIFDNLSYLSLRHWTSVEINLRKYQIVFLSFQSFRISTWKIIVSFRRYPSSRWS